MGLSLSLDFGAVVWCIEEEAMPLSVFYFCICNFSRRCCISTHLSLCRFSSFRQFCRCLQNNHLAIAMKRFVVLIIYYLIMSFLQ